MSEVLFKSLPHLNLACLLIILTVSIDSTTASVSELPAGYIHHSDINTAYKIHSSSVDWNGAHLICKSEGGRLAVTDTQTKVNYILAATPYLSWTWVGIYRQPMTNEWKSVDNSAMAGTLPWALLNPKLDVFGDCVTVGSTIVGSGLANWGCSGQRRFACEIVDVPTPQRVRNYI